MTYAIMLGVFVVLLFLGAPIALSLGMSSLLAILYNGTGINVVAGQIYGGIGKVSAAGRSVLRPLGQHHGQSRHLRPADRVHRRPAWVSARRHRDGLHRRGLLLRRDFRLRRGHRGGAGRYPDPRHDRAREILRSVRARRGRRRVLDRGHHPAEHFLRDLRLPDRRFREAISSWPVFSPASSWARP